MAKLISVRTRKGRKREFLKDVETGILYEIVKAGFSWPGVHSGFACIAARENGEERIRVLHESYEDSLDKLAKHLSTLQDLFFVGSWIVDYEGKNLGFRDLLFEIGRPLDKSFALVNPRLSPNFHLGIQLLRRCFKRNALILPHGGILEARINILNEATAREEELSEKFHEITTLANIVYEFDSIMDEAKGPKDRWDDEPFNPRKGSWMGM